MNTALKVPTIFSAIDKLTAPVQKMGSAVNTFASKTQAAFARAERSTRGFLTSANSIQSKIFNLHNAVGVLFAGMAIKKGFEIVTNAAEAGDEIMKTSSILGLTTKAYQELQFAAKRENISNETLTTSFLKMNKSVGELQKGHGQLFSSLSKTNPALLKQLKNTKSSEEAFTLLSKAVQDAPNQLQRTAIAASAFGRGGMEMMKLIEVGPAGIQKLRDEAQKLGIVMNDDMISGAAKFADAQDNMNAALTGLKVTVAGGLLPVMQNAIEKITAWTIENKLLIKQKTSEFFDKIAKAAEWVYQNFDKILSVGSKLLKGLAAIWVITKLLEVGLLAYKIIVVAATAAQWLYTAAMVASGTAQSASMAMTVAAEIMYGLYVAAVVAATAAQWLLNAALTANPIGLVIVAIASLIVLIYVIIKKWNDWGAALSLFTGPLGMVITLIQSFRRNWDMVKMAFKTEGIIGGLKAIGLTILDALIMPLQQVFKLLSKLPSFLGGGSGGLFDIRNSEMQAYRESLGVNTTTDESGNYLPGQNPATGELGSGVLKAINTKKTNQDAIVSRTETTQNKNVTFDFKNLPKGLIINGDGMSGNNMPALGSTFAM